VRPDIQTIPDCCLPLSRGSEEWVKSARKAKKHREIELGTIFEIDLGSMGRAYAVRCAGNDVAFFDYLSHEAPLPELLATKKILFRFNVAYDELVSGRWPIVGHMTLIETLAQAAAYWNQPVGSNDIFLYRNGKFQPATREDVRGLEPLITWFQSHSEERLRDHFEGRPNKTIEYLNRIKKYDAVTGMEIPPD
jgi:hypothetical protein